MLEAAGEGTLHALYVIGENPAVSDADTHHVEKALGRLDFLVVEDLFLTRTAQLAHVVLPAAAGWCETEGTVTASDRRVQRIRKALEPPPGARDDLEVVQDVARRLGAAWWRPQTAREIWDELRALSPIHRGMTYERLETGSGLRWPCWDESHPGRAVPPRAPLEDAVRGRAGAPSRPSSTIRRSTWSTPSIRCS